MQQKYRLRNHWKQKPVDKSHCRVKYTAVSNQLSDWYLGYWKAVIPQFSWTISKHVTISLERGQNSRTCRFGNPPDFRATEWKEWLRPQHKGHHNKHLYGPCAHKVMHMRIKLLTPLPWTESAVSYLEPMFAYDSTYDCNINWFIAWKSLLGASERQALSTPVLSGKSLNGSRTAHPRYMPCTTSANFVGDQIFRFASSSFLPMRTLHIKPPHPKESVNCPYVRAFVRPCYLD